MTRFTSTSSFKLPSSHFFDWEYRVISVNKAGESIPSNTVAAVV